ncbi:MAG: TonB-dependent receptor [Blastomonas sp.]
MKNFKRELWQTAAILTVASVATPAQAQINEIIVTAQKREQSSQDVPISLQVVSGEDLQDRQIAGAEDLADSLPNVFVTKDSVSNNIYIRGVGSGSNAGFEQAVSTFVDGVYHGRSRYSQSTLVDVERIEVLRGPQTIYFGNNAIGGAFSVTTAKPDLSGWEGYAQAAYEFEAEEKIAEAAIGGPIVQDKFGIRLAGRYSDMEGYIRNLGTGQDNPAVEDKYLRATMLYAITDSWSATFKAEYGKQDSIAPYAMQLTKCPPDAPFAIGNTFSCSAAVATNTETVLDYRRTSNEGERGDVEATEYVFRLEKDNLDGPGIVAQASLSKHDFLLGADTDGTPFDFFTYNTLEDLNQKTLEFRINSPASSSIEYTAGFYYLDSESRIDTTLNFPFATVLLADPTSPLNVLLPFAPLGGDIQLDQAEEAMSFFGSVGIPITDQLTLTAGLRYTHSRKRGIQSATNVTSNDRYGFSVTPLPAALQPVAAFLTGFNDHTSRAIVEDDDFLPSITLQYEPNPDINVYAKFSEGFKAGGFDAVELTGIVDRLSYAPETVKAYEAGFKAFLANRTLSVNLALFRSDYKDLQQSVAQFTATSAFITISNVGALRTQGLEAGIVWQPSDRFEFGTDFAILDAEYQDFTDAGCNALQALQATQAGQVGCSQDLSGKAPPFAPSYSGNIRAGYNTPIGSSLKLSIDTMLSFSGSYHTISDRDPNVKQKAWEKIDVRIALGDVDDRWSFAFFGKNLANTKVIGSTNDVVASAGSHNQQITRGRSLGVQARFKFN